jgi:hypothetical protein
MSDRNRRAGLLTLTVDGQIMEAKGTFTINPGRPLREPIIGADGLHGYKETPQAASIEGAITDAPGLNTEKLRELTNATITLRLNNGKTWMLEDAWFAGEGAMTTDESEIAVAYQSRYPAVEL